MDNVNNQQIIADDASVMAKGLHVWYKILSRNGGDISLIRKFLTYCILFYFGQL